MTDFRPLGALPPMADLDIRGDDGLRLRPWRTGDERGILRGVADPEYRRWNTPRRLVVTEADAAEYIRIRAEGYKRRASAVLCLTDGTDEVLGSVGLGVIDAWMRSGIVSYWVQPESRGRGLATRALLLYTGWAFERVGVHRISLGHATGHGASCRVAERCGYALEGVQREAMHAGNGRGGFRDMHLHARLASDPYPAFA
jgi:RimJ/RimL family protein N-acetyltransferase